MLSLLLFLWERPGLILLLIILLWGWEAWKGRPTWRPFCLVEVLDGDTVLVALPKDPRQRSSLRLQFIDAPEMKQGPIGKASRQALIGLLYRKSTYSKQYQCRLIYAAVKSKDVYGRLLGLVKLHPQDYSTVNEWMLWQGRAFLYPYAQWSSRGEQQRWKRWEQLAKFNRKGHWKDGRKEWQYPWIFRQQQKKF